jgi:hypothetical protein
MACLINYEGCPLDVVESEWRACDSIVLGALPEMHEVFLIGWKSANFARSLSKTLSC